MNILSRFAQLARHLVRNDAAETIAAQVVRAGWLKTAKAGDIRGGDIFDGGRCLGFLDGPRLNGKYRLVTSEVPREIGVAPQHTAPGSMNENQRRPRAFRLNRNEGGFSR